MKPVAYDSNGTPLAIDVPANKVRKVGLNRLIRVIYNGVPFFFRRIYTTEAQRQARILSGVPAGSIGAVKARIEILHFKC